MLARTLSFLSVTRYLNISESPYVEILGSFLLCIDPHLSLAVPARVRQTFSTLNNGRVHLVFCQEEGELFVPRCREWKWGCIVLNSLPISSKNILPLTPLENIYILILLVIIINSMYVCWLQSKLLRKELQWPFGNNLNIIASEQTVCGWVQWIKQCQRHTNPQQTPVPEQHVLSHLFCSYFRPSVVVFTFVLFTLKDNCNRDFIDESGRTCTYSFALSYRIMSWSLLLGILMVRLFPFSIICMCFALISSVM